MNRKIVTVEIEDEPGTLGKLTQCLADARLNVDGFSVESGHARLIVAQPDRAQTCLEDGGFEPRLVDAFEIELPNKPGQLANLGTQLGKAGVNIEACFGVATSTGGKLFVCTDNPTKAQPVIERITRAAVPPARH